MARKPKAPAAGEGDAVKPGEVMVMPSVAAVKATAKEIRSTINETSEINKTLSEYVAEAKASKGIHPGSIKRVEAWLNKAKKTDRGLAAVATELAHLDFYRDVLGLDKLLKEQGQMFARTEAGQDEPDDDIATGTADVAEDERDLRPPHMQRPEAQTPPETPTKPH